MFHLVVIILRYLHTALINARSCTRDHHALRQRLVYVAGVQTGHVHC